MDLILCIQSNHKISQIYSKKEDLNDYSHAFTTMMDLPYYHQIQIRLKAKVHMSMDDFHPL